LSNECLSVFQENGAQFLALVEGLSKDIGTNFDGLTKVQGQN